MQFQSLNEQEDYLQDDELSNIKLMIIDESELMGVIRDMIARDIILIR